MSKDTGETAFPNITPDMDVEGYPGMSLRDYFAAKAITPLIAMTVHSDQMSYRAANAILAYNIADAMIAERNK